MREQSEQTATAPVALQAFTVYPPGNILLTSQDNRGHPGRGLEIAGDIMTFDQGHQIIEDNLILPEILVESFSEPPGKILRPLFDLVWNACGFPKSKNFDDKGNWFPQR